MKPFVTNKNCLSNANITIIQNDNLITDENEVATTLNSHFIHIVENSSGIKPTSIDFKSFTDKKKLIEKILKTYKIIQVS